MTSFRYIFSMWLIVASVLLSMGCAQQYGSEYAKANGIIMSENQSQLNYYLIPYFDSLRRMKNGDHIRKTPHEIFSSGQLVQYPQRSTGSSSFTINSGTYLILYICGDQIREYQVDFDTNISKKPAIHFISC